LNDGFFLLLGLYGLFVLIWSGVSVFLVVGARTRLAALENQVARLTRALNDLPSPGDAAAGTAAEPPAPAAAAGDTAQTRSDVPESAAAAEMPPSEEPASATPGPVGPQAEPQADPDAEEPAAAAARTAEPPPEPPARPAAGGVDLETRIGGRLFVWLGAVALALAGGFLVKYSIDEGLLTPARRVIGGYLLGGVMLAVGHRLAATTERIAAAVLAAGIATFYAASFAASSLYGLVSPPVGFAMLVAVTTAAEVLALRHGRLIALVGLVGGYATPILVGSPDPNVPVLFAYLFLLTFGLGLIGLRRPWPELPAVAAVAAFAWGALWLVAGYEPAQAPTAALYLLALTALVAAFGVSAGRLRLPFGIGPLAPLLIYGAWAAGGLLLVALVRRAGHDPILVWALWLHTAAALAFARRWQGRWEVALVAAVLPLLAIADWTWPRLDWQTREPLPAPAGALALHLVFALTWALGGGAAAFGARRPGLWAAIATVPVILLGLASYNKDLLAWSDLGWAWLALGVAALYAAAAAGWGRYRLPDPARDPVLAAYVTASAGLIAIAVSMMVTSAWLGLAWSLTVLAMAAVGLALAVPALRVLAAVLGALASLAVLLEAGGTLDLPAGVGAFGDAVARTGLPAAGLAAAAVLMVRRGDDLWAQVVQALAAVLGGVFLFFAVRAWFPPVDLPGAEWNGWELGLVVTLAQAYALALGRLALRRRDRAPLLPTLARAAAVVALAVVAYGAVQVLPPGGAEPVGETPFLNALILLWALPAVLAFALVGQAAGRPFAVPGGRPARRTEALAGAAALVLAFGFVTLEVRQLFHAPRLFPGPIETGELYAYSAVWLAFALATFFAGVTWQRRPLRAAGLGVMSLALAKVFLWDAAALDGLWRVASFLGLGISLLLVAWLFQRFVGRAAPSDPAAAA